MYHLLKSKNGHFNAFCDVICDTTGTTNSIKDCFTNLHRIKGKRYENLQDFMNKSSYKSLVCSFKSKTFSAVRNEYPELFI